MNVSQTQTQANATAKARPILQVEHLEVTYYTDAGRAKALDDVSLP